MTDGVPLKLRLEPGEYRCIWLVPDRDDELRRLDGDIELSVERPPTGNAYGGVPVAWRHGVAAFPQTYSYEILRGELRNGLDVILIEAEIHIWSEDRALITGRVALVGSPGVFQSENPVFDDVKLQITGLDAFAGVGPLRSFTVPSHGRDFYDHPWQVEANPESKQSWSDEGATIDLSYDAALSIGDPFFYRMAFSPVARITLTSAASFGECLSRWIEPLRRLVTISTGRAEDLTYVSMGLRGDNNGRRRHRLQVYGAGLNREPFASRQNDVLRIRTAFSIKQDSLSVLQLLRAWQGLLDGHHPLLETYGSSIVIPRQHPRAQYLLLLQAFEGLHGHERKSEYVAKAERHARKREEAISAVAGCAGVPKPVLKFVRHFLAKRVPSSLDEVLNDTFSGIPGDVTADLAQSELILSVQDDPRRPQGVVGALRIIRNDLAHGNKGYPIDQLDHVSAILERVARAHMLRILGCGQLIQGRALGSET